MSVWCPNYNGLGSGGESCRNRGLGGDHIRPIHANRSNGERPRPLLAYAAGAVDVRELPIRADAARIHNLLAEAAATRLGEGTGLTEQRAEELISEIQASRKTR